MNRSLRRLLVLALGSVWLLAGCATSYLLDNNVNSFSSLATLPAQPAFRFDRLPSQQSPAQLRLEALAEPALIKAGLRRDEANPRYAVQVNARIQRVLSPWASPAHDWGWDGGWSGSWGHRGFGHGHGHSHGPLFAHLERSWFQREVSVIVRETASNRVVFESQAANHGPLQDSTEVLPAMFEAALQGFPSPPAGLRRVNILIGQR